MADEGAEFLINNENINEKHIVTLQILLTRADMKVCAKNMKKKIMGADTFRPKSAIRGSLVRKWIKEVRESFRDVVSEIEKNPNVCVDWDKQLPCLPKVYRQRQSNTREAERNLHHPSSDVGMHKKINKTGAPICQDKLDKQVDTGASNDKHNLFVNTENEQHKLRSAETQTSFVEICNAPSADWAKKDHTSNTLLMSHTDREAIRNSERVSCEDKPENIIIESGDKLPHEKEVPSRHNLKSYTDHLDIVMSDTMDGLPCQSNQQSSLKSYSRADEQCDFVTEVEDFEPTDSDRSRHSSISIISNQSEKCSIVQNESQKESDKTPVYKSDVDSHGTYNNKTGMDSDRSMKSQKLQKYGDKGVEQISQNERPDSARSQDSRRSDHSRTSQRSSKNDLEQERSVERIKSPFSDRSETSQRSLRSGTSQKSSNSQQAEKSRKSERSKRNDGIKVERRSRTAHSTPEREHDIMSPRPSSISPVPLSRRQEEKVAQPFPGTSNQDSTTLTNVTSVWDSLNSFRESCDNSTAIHLPEDPDELRELRKNISMELLWVQQAIISRKNYLKLKNNM